MIKKLTFILLISIGVTTQATTTTYQATYEVLENTKTNLLPQTISEIYRIPVDQATYIVNLVYKEAAPLDVDPLDVLALMAVESSFQQYATTKTSIGLLQINVYAQRRLIRKITGPGSITALKERLYDVDVNIKVGVQIIKRLQSEYATGNGAYILATQFPTHDKSWSGLKREELDWHTYLTYRYLGICEDRSTNDNYKSKFYDRRLNV